MNSIKYLVSIIRIQFFNLIHLIGNLGILKEHKLSPGKHKDEYQIWEIPVSTGIVSY